MNLVHHLPWDQAVFTIFKVETIQYSPRSGTVRAVHIAQKGDAFLEIDFQIRLGSIPQGWAPIQT